MKLPSILSAAILAALAADAAKIQARDTTGSAALATSPPFYPSPWMNPDAPDWQQAYSLAKDFVSQMTLMEKVNLTTGVGWMSERCVGNTGAVPRLGLRGLCTQDGPLGLRFSDYNSAFSTGMTAGASWSRPLWKERGVRMGSEAKGKGVDVLLGPVCGPLGRSPNGGRNVEGFSTDPYMAGQAVSETSVGIQDAGTIASLKHFIGNEQERFRQVGESRGRGFDITEAISSNIDDRTLHELYGWCFQDAVKAGVGSIMCSYNQVNNSYGCANSHLLNGILKEEWGFQGFVVSDWQAQHSGVSSALAGLDMTMPGDTMFNTGASYWGANLTLAVANGTVPEWRIDDMAMRIMSAFFKVGKTVEGMEPVNFDSWTRDSFGYVSAAAKDMFERVNFQVDVRADNANHIREVGAKGTVILKNEGVLPLNKPKFIAVVGEDAGSNPAGPNGCDDQRCDDGTLAMEWGSGTANFPYLVTPDMALSRQADQDGTRYESILSNYLKAQTQALVTQPDVTAIVFANAKSGEGFIVLDGNDGDRKNLTLWKNGDDLIKNVASLCNNTIVVLHTTGPVQLQDYRDHPNITAIVWAGAPGQESGNSLVDILYGVQSPGRSTFTWGTSLEAYNAPLTEQPNNGNGGPQADFTEGLFIDYRHFDKVAPGAPGSSPAHPVYEFGFGLSWSTFDYTNIRVEKHENGPYVPTSGKTIAAPEFGNFSTDLKDYAFPANIRKVKKYIYPNLDDTSSGKAASRDAHYGLPNDQYLPPKATDGSPQPRSGASGEPGGNRQLWDIFYTVSVDITNTGKAMTDEIPQLYVSHGGPNDPVRVLRQFDRLERIEPGQTVTWSADLTRRDISTWDTETQDWVITDYPKHVWVGQSSRNLPLDAALP
ncbi:putative beta-glucosidase A [Escovopsis weberi]|uniref:beta-glucosidase n=1 Tax=Escovopsis weberi TaxID=150374 RepID=A0A0M8N239_ESCWE|nr:putative beta-glucosidase A [Escovopsis weberi]